MIARLALLFVILQAAQGSKTVRSSRKRDSEKNSESTGPTRRPERRRDRWENYAAGTGVEHFAWWCSENLIQTVDPFTGQPLDLEPWQIEFMGEALAVDDALDLLWQSVVLVVSRKNGKTAMLAAYALYHLFNDEGSPEILLAAASDKNAGRLFDACVAFVRANPELERLVHIREYVGEIALVGGGGGKIIRLATDPTTLHGYNPSLVICDELHAWTKPSLRKVWAALTSAGGARKRRQVFTISTAGEAKDRKEGILGRMIDGNEAAVGDDLEKPDKGLKISRNFAAQVLIYNYSAPTLDPHDIPAMKLANPASWITPDYLKRQAADPELSDAEVLQLHGCVWATGERTWLDPALVVPLAKPRTKKRMKGVEVVLAFDGSYSRDSTVLYGATVEKRPYLWVESLWEKPPGAARTWRISRLDADAAVVEAMEKYHVVELAPDPPGWHREIEEWEETYGEVVVRFETNQPRRMGPACDDFEQAVRGEEFTTDGHEALIRHLGHCVPKRRGAYTVVTKEEPDSPLKIDVAVGAIIAYHRAAWHYTKRQEEAGPMVAWA